MRRATYSFINGNRVDVEYYDCGIICKKWQRPPGALEDLGLLMIGEHLHQELMPGDDDSCDKEA